MIVSSTEIILSREVGEGRVRVEEDPQNYDDEKNFFRGAAKVQKSVIPAKAGIQVPLTDGGESPGFPFAGE
jgi:hypothetical protein